MKSSSPLKGSMLELVKSCSLLKGHAKKMLESAGEGSPSRVDECRNSNWHDLEVVDSDSVLY
jgi:hypothetical protein